MTETDSSAISVILTNYNYGRFLAEAIESVLKQTHAALELIVVDDCSTDNSREVLAAFGNDKRVKTVLHDVNKGQAAAFNSGFSVARGGIIAFLDSDDFWEENKLEEVTRAFDREDVVLVQHDLKTVDEASVPTGSVIPGLTPGVRDILQAYFEENHTGFFSAASGLACRREALEKILPLDETWRICADVALSRPLPLFGKVCTLPEPLGFYRVHGANSWMRSEEQSGFLQNAERHCEYANRCMERFGEDRRIEFRKSEPYLTRQRHMQFNLRESSVVREYFGSGGMGAVMIDVGAHRGGTALPFLRGLWRVFAFEPDATNRETLQKLAGKYENLHVDARAVSDSAQQDVPFYTSEVSSGIGSLLPFHESHSQAALVTTTTLRDVIAEQKLQKVDFLKVDTEGHDLAVLQGYPWSQAKPAVVMCEFEDSKTSAAGYGFHDLCRFLVDQGYELLVSEWYPILAYESQHSWRRLSTYPCELEDAEGWGNILAFRDPINWPRLTNAVIKHLGPRLGAMDRRVRNRETENKHQETIIASLQEDVAWMQGTVSWKVTYPLRRLTAALRRLMGREAVR